ncbi:permease [Anaerosporomusa subterranea]|uniref:Probable membrane transporter protein n=1 Tax=Anaerosporomusa subterranea TaxID=1794912 RepID=A0A154BNC2_ANASB|nr:permease [Anaerosporomusa subterranea]
MTVLLTVGIGLIVGVMSGLLGIGGGVVMVPLMVFILGIGQHMAQGISMLVIIPTSLVAIYHLHQDKLVDYRIAAYLAAGAICGALISANFVQYIPATELKRIFGIFVIFTGGRMLLAKRKPAK